MADIGDPVREIEIVPFEEPLPLEVPLVEPSEPELEPDPARELEPV